MKNLSHDEEMMVDFIKKCLTMDPLERIKCEEALNHPWLDDVRRE